MNIQTIIFIGIVIALILVPAGSAEFESVKTSDNGVRVVVSTVVSEGVIIFNNVEHYYNYSNPNNHPIPTAETLNNPDLYTIINIVYPEPTNGFIVPGPTKVELLEDRVAELEIEIGDLKNLSSSSATPQDTTVSSLQANFTQAQNDKMNLSMNVSDINIENNTQIEPTEELYNVSSVSFSSGHGFGSQGNVSIDIGEIVQIEPESQTSPSAYYTTYIIDFIKSLFS